MAKPSPDARAGGDTPLPRPARAVMVLGASSGAGLLPTLFQDLFRRRDATNQEEPWTQP